MARNGLIRDSQGYVSPFIITSYQLIDARVYVNNTESCSMIRLKFKEHKAKSCHKWEPLMAKDLFLQEDFS